MINMDSAMEAEQDGNFQKAIEIYKALINNGYNTELYFFIGEIYRRGRGNVSSNIDEALKYYFKGAVYGCVDSTFRIGKAYYDKKEYENAIKWVYDIAEKGYMQALGMLVSMHNDKLFSNMNVAKTNVTKSDMLADIWKEFLEEADDDSKRKMEKFRKGMPRELITKAENLAKKQIQLDKDSGY